MDRRPEIGTPCSYLSIPGKVSASYYSNIHQCFMVVVTLICNAWVVIAINNDHLEIGK